ncbi:hypothetical protein, partial [Sphingomonas sp.]|uniref:hypothetical protein n=1 Tax=Sphingomonas sp. TaxID=28214 RepID=UPI00258CAC43
MTKTGKRHFCAIGNIRGNCGHAHRTIAAALKCADSDHRACRAGGSLSDRTVAAVSGRSPDWLDPIPMTAEEEATIRALQAERG